VIVGSPRHDDVLDGIRFCGGAVTAISDFEAYQRIPEESAGAGRDVCHTASRGVTRCHTPDGPFSPLTLSPRLHACYHTGVFFVLFDTRSRFPNVNGLLKIVPTPLGKRRIPGGFPAWPVLFSPLQSRRPRLLYFTFASPSLHFSLSTNHELV
jgi:hypothetical protein